MLPPVLDASRVDGLFHSSRQQPVTRRKLILHSARRLRRILSRSCRWGSKCLADSLNAADFRNDGSCMLLCQGHHDHVWAYGFVQTRTHNGHALRMPIIIDEAARVASYNPWLSLAWLATGKSLGGDSMYGDNNLLTRHEALRLWTINGAASTMEEAVKGSIEPGKLADLAVLDRDYFSVPDGELRRIESLMTIVDGEITYATGPFAEHDAPALPDISPAWSPVAVFGGYV